MVEIVTEKNKFDSYDSEELLRFLLISIEQLTGFARGMDFDNTARSAFLVKSSLAMRALVKELQARNFLLPVEVADED